MFLRTIDKKFKGEFHIQPSANDVYREASPVDMFHQVNGISSSDGKKFVRYVDPIFVIFNQERLQKLGVDGVENYVKSLFNTTNSELAKLRKQCSDDELLNTIKSRHLQSPSEILAWTRYMSQNLNEFNRLVNDVNDEIAARQRALDVQQSLQSQQSQQTTVAAE